MRMITSVKCGGQWMETLTPERRASSAIIQIIVALLAVPLVAQEQAPPVERPSFAIATGSRAHSSESGICAGALLSDDTGPIAWFGLVKLPQEDTRFSYLILLRPSDRSEKSSVQFKRSRVSESGSEANVDAHMVLKWGDGRFHTQWAFEADDSEVKRDRLILGDRQAADDEVRVYVLDASGDAFVCRPVSTDAKLKAPDVRKNSGDWVPVVSAAIKRLEKESPQVAKFLKGDR